MVMLLSAFLIQSKIMAQEKGEKLMEIKSPAFENNSIIPSKYTCDGEDISPPLSWSDIPEGTKSLALISDDPDAPAGTWVHWVIYNIPPSVTSLPEGVPTDKKLSNGTLQGITDFKRIGYGGPCPPSGTHRYFFKLYALNKKVPLDAGATKKQVLDAIKDSVIAECQVVGKYQRKR